MILNVKNTKILNGEIKIPSSKSHTIRAILIASLAKGTSTIINPLFSEDTKAAINGCVAFGSDIEINNDNNKLIIQGFDGKPKEPKEKLKMLNSGTSTNLLTSIAALGDFKTLIDGDASLRKRPVQPLLDALQNLGAKTNSLNRDGCLPIEINGPLRGGKTDLDCKSSQFLSSLLIACPLLKQDTEIHTTNLCEIPYIKMTLGWLDYAKIRYDNQDLSEIKIFSNQKYSSFEKTIPRDWSSAAFPICAASITDSKITIEGLDIKDSQGDKKIIGYLKKMGAKIQTNNSEIRINGSELNGCELDLNETPDLLPVMAVVGCYAKGQTKLTNVAHAKIKETDRIKVMHDELLKMGAKIEETADGLIINQKALKGALVNGHSDHRVVMALSLAGMIAEGQTEIETAESIAVTYPSYIKSMKTLGANMEVK